MSLEIAIELAHKWGLVLIPTELAWEVEYYSDDTGPKSCIAISLVEAIENALRQIEEHPEQAA